MRILFILEYYHPHTGGVETLFKSLAESLDDLGHEVAILTNRFDRSLLPEESFGRSGNIVRKRYLNRYIFTFGAWWAAIGLARKADIIHTTSYNAAIPAWIASKTTRTKAVITFHEYWGRLWYELPWMSYPSRVLHSSFERLIGRMKFNRFIAVSDATKSSLLEAGIDETKVITIHNGLAYVDFPSHQGSHDKEHFQFLFFGRVGYSKGLDVLLEAYAMLVSRRSDHHLTLVIPSEKNPLLKKVIQLIQDLKLEKEITILHDLARSDLRTSIAQSDAVVIPSYSEGFCFAAVETMAIGTPIISSGRKALKEVISGRFIEVEPFDSDAFSKALESAIDGRWQERPLMKFELMTTIEQYQAMYKSVL